MDHYLVTFGGAAIGGAVVALLFLLVRWISLLEKRTRTFVIGALLLAGWIGAYSYAMVYYTPGWLVGVNLVLFLAVLIWVGRNT